ncbi:hypothetical protein OG923_32515 [Streptomyces halstedii]|uniref:hypothetical protein n=1 Tax=Streptomyces halstedii TaxID=1944 RepID=UPI0032477B97
MAVAAWDTVEDVAEGWGMLLFPEAVVRPEWRYGGGAAGSGPRPRRGTGAGHVSG